MSTRVQVIFNLGQDMAREQDGTPLAEVLDELTERPDLVRIKTDRRLVEDQQRRVVDERVREADALVEALGERADDAAGDIAEAALLLDSGSTRSRVTPRPAVQPLEPGPGT